MLVRRVFSLCLVYTAICCSTALPETTTTNSPTPDTLQTTNDSPTAVAATQLGKGEAYAGARTGKQDFFTGGSGTEVQCGWTDDELCQLKVKKREPKDALKLLKTWYVYLIKQKEISIESDTVPCLDQYMDYRCVAAKFQFSNEDEKHFKNQVWGATNTLLTNVQYTTEWAHPTYRVLHAQVNTVRTGDKESRTITDSSDPESFIDTFSTCSVILGGDLRNYLITMTGGQTVEEGTVIISLDEDLYGEGLGNPEKQATLEAIKCDLESYGLSLDDFKKFTRTLGIDTNSVKYVNSSPPS